MANPLRRYANATLEVPTAGVGAAIQDPDGNWIAPNASTLTVKAMLRGYASAVGAALSRTETTGVDQSSVYLSGRLVDPNYLPFGISYPVECECTLNSGECQIKGIIQLEVHVQEGFAGRAVEDKIGQFIGGRFYMRGASDG